MAEKTIEGILERFKQSKVFKPFFDSLDKEGYDELVEDIIHCDTFTHVFGSYWDEKEIYCNNCKWKGGTKTVLCMFCINQVNFHLDGEISSIRFTKEGIEVTIDKEKGKDLTILKWNQ